MEVYEKCDDLNINNTNESINCDNLKLYNGKQCYFDSRLNICKSKDKICEEALNNDECSLISISGFSNPDKRVCDYITISGDLSPSCVENYKFCSDYRRNNTQICESIKPYDLLGN